MNGIHSDEAASRRVSPQVLRSSLWLRAGFIAAGVAVYGVSLILETPGEALNGLLLALGGAAGAYGAVLRSYRLLDSPAEAGEAKSRAEPKARIEPAVHLQQRHAGL